MDLRGNRVDVLLTGSSGFVGRRLASRLVRRGDRVVGTTFGEGPPAEGWQAVELDLLQPEALPELARRFEPDVVVHLAGLSHVGESWRKPGVYFQVNVLGTERLLAAFPSSRTFLASSAEVYGNVPEEQQPIDESRVPAPENPYGLTKAAAERLVLAAGGTVLRFFAFIGAGQPRNFALPDFAAQLAANRTRGKTRLAVGNLEARRAFLNVDDGIDGIVAAIEKGLPGAVYNVGGEQAPSVRSVLAMLIERSGLDVEVVTDESRLRPVDTPLLSPRLERLKALGWQPRRSLEETVAEIWEEALRSSDVGG
jgi:GDP-4-dehydro-6-deoxy-D-mannose reductase